MSTATLQALVWRPSCAFALMVARNRVEHENRKYLHQSCSARARRAVVSNSTAFLAPKAVNTENRPNFDMPFQVMAEYSRHSGVISIPAASTVMLEGCMQCVHLKLASSLVDLWCAVRGVNPKSVFLPTTQIRTRTGRYFSKFRMVNIKMPLVPCSTQRHIWWMSGLHASGVLGWRNMPYWFM